MNTYYILDKFVTTKTGEPYRLLPFGPITRGGVTHDMTPEYAARFKLPPFKPPIKLGSHEEITPAGGHLVKLEVRADGLYGYPELTEKGSRAFSDGDYRYHSPEVIWSGGGLETSDGILPGPMIIGDSLLHTPYLGESTAFYTADTKEEFNMQENISVPKSFLETLLGYLQPKKEETPSPPAPPVTPVEETEQFKAAVIERETYKAQLETIKADNAMKEQRQALTAQLQKRENYGMVYTELSAADEAATVLATMSDQNREWVMRNFKAFIAQIDESKLTGEVGSSTSSVSDEDPKSRYNALVLKIAQEKSINYVDAFELGKTVHADAFNAAFAKRK